MLRIQNRYVDWERQQIAIPGGHESDDRCVGTAPSAAGAIEIPVSEDECLPIVTYVSPEG
jgi:hypothetical protein